MKSLTLKIFIAASGAFAAYYLFFLCSAAYDLYRPLEPGMPRCATGVVWSLQGAACIFAAMALVTDVGLWFVGKEQLLSGVMFPKLRGASLIALLLCALVNLLIFIPGL
jgi:hypothetical protein